MCDCAYEYTCAYEYEPEQVIEEVRTPELQAWNPVWVLGPTLRSSGRAVCTPGLTFSLILVFYACVFASIYLRESRVCLVLLKARKRPQISWIGVTNCHVGPGN